MNVGELYRYLGRRPSASQVLIGVNGAVPVPAAAAYEVNDTVVVITNEEGESCCTGRRDIDEARDYFGDAKACQDGHAFRLGGVLLKYIDGLEKLLDASLRRRP